MRRLEARSLAGAIMLATLSCGGGDGGGGPDPETPVIVKAGAPNGDLQVANAGAPLADSFRVVVTEGGAPKAGATVTWSSTASGAVLSPASSITDANGRAATRMTLGGVAGVQSARASVAGRSVSFSVTGTPGPAALFELTSGNDQAALGGVSVANPLRVRVLDQFGNPVNGSTVSWTIISGGGTLSAHSSVTANGGVASVGATTGGAPGTTEVQAVSAGSDTLLFRVHTVSLIRDVQVKNNFFESVRNGSQAPSIDTIPAGEAIRWLWQSAEVEHNIISQGPPLFASLNGSIKTPFTYGPVRFDQPGTYQYHCNLHAGMDGVIVVE
jgi:plastocyanin